MQRLQIMPVAGRCNQHRDTDIFRSPVGVDGDAILILSAQAFCLAHIAYDLFMFENFARILAALDIGGQIIFIYQVAVMDLFAAVVRTGRRKFNHKAGLVTGYGEFEIKQ